MRLALAQINPTIGDLERNARRIIDTIDAARRAEADLVAFPELSVCGYPPKDLLLHEGFTQACRNAAEEIGRHTDDICVIIGLPLAGPDANTIYNALLAYENGRCVATYRKRLLPTYDVFDEDRYFTPGDATCVIEVCGIRVGLAICEDLWRGADAGFSWRYRNAADPVKETAHARPHLLLSPSASPFVLHKNLLHRDLLARHAAEHRMFVASVNQVGGNDELVFDGHSAVFAPTGDLIASSPGFEDDLLVVDIEPGTKSNRVPDPRVEAPAEELIFKALRLGVRDYLAKTGFSRAVIGLSGGLDSSVTAAIAAGAIGAANVTGITMPGPYSSDGARDDAHDLASRLGIRTLQMPISDVLGAVKRVVDPAFAKIDARPLGDELPDVAEENVQARIRGLLLMAHANRTGDILLTTGNKSEIAVGYCTLYGDMNGGLAVISDVLKTQLYALAGWMNANAEASGFAGPPIPQSTIDKPPSAELAPNQRDDDSLPPYPVLDQIIERYVEQRQQPSRIAQETGIDGALVDRVVRMIDRNEYKRKQMATGLKVTHVAFGFGRRMPIAQRWVGG
jgi:NAD+ synthetase